MQNPVARRILIGLGALLLVCSVVVVVWQGSFNSGSFPRPEDPTETYVYFGLSILIFLLMLALGYWLARLAFKLWIARQTGGAGSRIQTRLVVGALTLSILPVFFMALFSFFVLNRTLQHWFTAPSEHVVTDVAALGGALRQETSATALAEARLVAEATANLEPAAANDWLRSFCQENALASVRILLQGQTTPLAACGKAPASTAATAVAPIRRNGAQIGSVYVAQDLPLDVTRQQKEINEHVSTYWKLLEDQKRVRSTLLLVLVLIALFVLFVATWMAQYLARLITMPIGALAQAAAEVSRGNLAHRVESPGIDELAGLVAGFNRMTADLEANRSELETRRRFTETILESVPTGIISIDSAGSIRRVNKALTAILPDGPAEPSRLDDLFGAEDTVEIRYLMNRARRTGIASRQFEIRTAARTLHLGITVAAVQGARNAGFVIVIEDTSDLLRAQKVAAWSEVARRVAHEIRNPLTPITLSAERVIRQADRTALPAGADHALRECAETILRETASVKRLVDEFTHFSRLPAAKLVITDLNEIVTSGLAVFEGRLEGVDLDINLADGLPPVMADPEQMKRVVVNLVDNAAEALQDAPVRRLTVRTRLSGVETCELTVTDTGCGVSAEEKEKLFLPYFSTKGRGTGLGLAIVSHILSEHDAVIRVEDNKPSGARFTIEIPAASNTEVADETAREMAGARA